MERPMQVRALVTSLAASSLLSDRRSNPSAPPPDPSAVWPATARMAVDRLSSGEFSRQMRLCVAAVVVYCDVFLVSPARLLHAPVGSDADDDGPVLFFEADGVFWADVLTAGGELRAVRRARRAASAGAAVWPDFAGVRLLDCLVPLSALWAPSDGSPPVLASDRSDCLAVPPFGDRR